MTEVTFHTAPPAEVQTMLDWAADEGWNPGHDDAAAFYAADPDGFFTARHAGEMVAAISVVNHSAEMAFLGLYLCRPEFRGRGIGLALWRHALAHAGTRTIGLDGVAAQQDNYARSGFVRAGATTRFCGPLPSVTPAETRAFDPARDRSALAALDREAVGYARPGFLAAWLTDHPTRKTVVIEQAGAITGFATARLCREGCKIGPVVAPDASTALSLLVASARALKKAAMLYVDLPDYQRDFRERLTALGFRPTFETARMYRGEPPATSPLAMAIATMELG